MMRQNQWMSRLGALLVRKVDWQGSQLPAGVMSTHDFEALLTFA